VILSKIKLPVLSHFAAFIGVLCLTSGCVSTMSQTKNLKAFNDLYISGQYNEAADVEIKKRGQKETKASSLLPSLQAAVALRYDSQYENSSLLFDECEEIIKQHNEKILAADAVSNFGAVIVNDAVLDYRAQEYDGVMLNTYKALNFWQDGKRDMARIEFNRALDRQRRAKERFSAEIAKLKKDLEKKQEEQNAKAQQNNKQELPTMDIDKAANNPEIDRILKEKYSSLYEFSTYPDFINPFTTYLAGLFFMAEKDFSKASTLLKEAYGMLENHTVVGDDFARLEGIIGDNEERGFHTWIIFENGLGPEKEEFRVDLPILLFTDKVKYTGIALPKLKFRDEAYSYLTVNNGQTELGRTCFLASMDRVVQTEFKKRYQAVVIRAVTSTLIKTFGQYMAQKQFGDLGGFAMAIYQGATTSADIRIWSALPKEFQIAKIKTPDCGLISLETPAGEKIDMSVPSDRNSLVYVKIPARGTKAILDVIEM
jgi:uncharacterized protein